MMAIRSGLVKKLDSVVILICVHFSDLSLYVRNLVMLGTNFIWEFCVVGVIYSLVKGRF